MRIVAPPAPKRATSAARMSRAPRQRRPARRRQAGADRPDRLVGDDESSARGAVRQRALQLRARRPRASRPASRSAARLADADDRGQPGALRRLRLGAHRAVALAMARAPLRMADDHGSGARILQHLGARCRRCRRRVGLGMAVLRRRPRAASRARLGQRASSVAGGQISTSRRAARAAPVARSRASSAAAARSPFIFQFPATRRPCCAIPTPSLSSAHDHTGVEAGQPASKT